MSGNIFNKQGFGIPVIIKDGEDYLSLSAMCKDCGYEPVDVIRNFLSAKNVLRFIITRQIIDDPEYMDWISNMTGTDGEIKPGKFAGFDSDTHTFIERIDSIVEYIRTTHTRLTATTLINEYAITGLYVKKGRNPNRGIYAHHDIALQFATWLNSAYAVLVNREYQRLKNKEMDELLKRGVEWKFSRRDAALWHR